MVAKKPRIMGWLAVAAAIAVAIALPIVRPQWVANKRSAQSIIKQEGLLEQFHWPPYFIGVGLMLVAARRDRAYRGFYGCAALGLFMLGWRQADFDDWFLGDRWYDGPGHLLKGEIPTPNALALCALFAVFVVAGAAILRRHHRDVLPWLRDHRWRWPGIVGFIGMFFLAASLGFDKYATFAKHTGIDLHIRFAAHWEEAVEMIGAAVLMLAAVEVFAIAEAKTAPPDADA